MTSPVPAGVEVHVVSCAALDEDHDVSSSIEIGIMSGTAKTLVDKTAGTFPAGTSHSITFPFSLLPGQRVYATFNNATAKDRLKLNVFGKLICRGMPDKELHEYMQLIDYHGKGW